MSKMTRIPFFASLAISSLLLSVREILSCALNYVNNLIKKLNSSLRMLAQDIIQSDRCGEPPQPIPCGRNVSTLDTDIHLVVISFSAFFSTSRLSKMGSSVCNSFINPPLYKKPSTQCTGLHCSMYP